MQNETEILSVAEQIEEEFLRLYEECHAADAPERKKADVIDSFWSDIYKAVFKPSVNEAKINNSRSKLKTYDVTEVEEVVNMYIKLCKRYGGVIKINQFANLTGIHRATLWLWNTKNNSSGYIFNLDSGSIAEEQSSIIYILKDNNDVDVIYNGNSKFVNGINSKDIGNTVYLSSTRFDVIKKLREEMQDSNTNGLSNDTMGHAIRANNEDELGKLYEPKRMLQQATIKHALGDAELPKLGINKTQYIEQNSQES